MNVPVISFVPSPFYSGCEGIEIRSIGLPMHLDWGRIFTQKVTAQKTL